MMESNLQIKLKEQTKEDKIGAKENIQVSLKDKTTAEQVEFEELLYLVASKISTLQEWKKYIMDYYKEFCLAVANSEAKFGKKNGNDNKKPIAIITGGQPGAGKSVLIAIYTNLLKENHGIDVLVNNADIYRFCVPGSYIISRDFPENASEITDPVVKEMRKNLISESIAQKQSIIIENTLGDTLAVDQMIQAGVHDVWVAVMAVPREESLLSDFERYIKMKEKYEVARLVSVEAHDKRYYALDKNIEKLMKAGIRIIVHSRGKTEHDLANIEYDSFDTNNKKYNGIIDAINSIRRKSLIEKISGYSERLKVIREKMEYFGMTQDEEEELKKLEDIINETILINNQIRNG